MERLRFVFLVLVGFCCLGFLNAKRQLRNEDIISKVNEFVSGTMECYDIPGMALTIIRNKEVLLSTGYGLKDLEDTEPFNNKTMVVIASLTKAFAATLLAQQLGKQENFTWDTPVREILDETIYIADGYITQKANLRDLLGHRINFPRHDVLRLGGFNLEEMLKERMHHIPYNRNFRQYSYNNLMYGYAAYVSQVLAGNELSWEELVKESIFQPLGMTASDFVHKARDRWDEFATAYRYYNNNLRKVSLEVSSAFYETFGAAGAVSSNAEDMAKWMQLLLNNGMTPDGVEIVERNLLLDTFDPAILSATRPLYVRPNNPVTYTLDKYGMGWSSGFYRGYPIISHGGSQGGYLSLITLVPSMDFAIYCTITSPANGRVRGYIHQFIMDLLLTEEPWLSVDTVCGPRKPDGSFYKFRGRRSAEDNPDSVGADSILSDIISRSTKKENKFKSKNAQGDRQENLETSKKVKGQQNVIKPRPLPKKYRTKEDRIRALEKYTGVYGNFAYGNVTITIDPSPGLLVLSYGPLLQCELQEVYTRGFFLAKGREPLWSVEMVISFLGEDENTEEIEEVLIPFEASSPSIFKRNLKQDQAPEPPELCEF